MFDRRVFKLEEFEVCEMLRTLEEIIEIWVQFVAGEAEGDEIRKMGEMSVEVVCVEGRVEMEMPDFRTVWEYIEGRGGEKLFLQRLEA